jgi:predicted small integral membrane protein
MLMDLLGVAGILTLGYLTYEVCRTDRKMCRLGVVGIAMVLLAYVGRYADMDRSVLIAVALLAVVVAVAVLSGRL